VKELKEAKEVREAKEVKGVEEVKEVQDVEERRAILSTVIVGRGFNRDICEVVFFGL